MEYGELNGTTFYIIIKGTVEILLPTNKIPLKEWTYKRKELETLLAWKKRDYDRRVQQAKDEHEERQYKLAMIGRQWGNNKGDSGCNASPQRNERTLNPANLNRPGEPDSGKYAPSLPSPKSSMKTKKQFAEFDMKLHFKNSETDTIKLRKLKELQKR